jgi:hypothetical protein
VDTIYTLLYMFLKGKRFTLGFGSLFSIQTGTCPFVSVSHGRACANFSSFICRK